MTQAKVVLETEQEYDERFQLDVEILNTEKVVQKDSGWKAAFAFFKMKAEAAAERGEQGDAHMIADLNNEFVQRHFEYICLGYKEALKHEGMVLPKEESRKLIKRAKAKLRRLKQKEKENG